MNRGDPGDVARGISPSRLVRGAAAALILVAVLGATAASASAATYRFRVLSASETYTVTASRGTVSGHRTFTNTLTGTVPDDPENSYTTGPGSVGPISTRSSITNTSPTTGEYTSDTIDNSNPPCHHDYGVTASNGASIGVALFSTNDPATVKVTTSFGPPGVGDVYNGACGGPIDVHFPYGEPYVNYPAAQLFSGDPVTLTIAGSKTFMQDILGKAASVNVSYSVSMKVEAIGEQLRIDPAAATAEDQGGPAGKWQPKIPVTWKDEGCANPPENTATPRAYLIAGPKRGSLGSLLGTKEENLVGAAGFSGRALKLKKGISVVTPATSGANAVRWKQAVNRAHHDGTLKPGRGVFYGGRIACKLKSKPSKFTDAKSPTFTLCHDQSSLSGESWTGLKPEMQAALGRLWKVLEPMHACYAINSGFRSQKTQDALREKWHQIADRTKGDNRTAAEIHSALKQAGFAQDPAGYEKPNRNGKRIAKGGPAIFSLHSLGIASDVHVEFSDTGEFEQSRAKLHSAAHAAGLCGPPASDPVHVELPFIAGKDPKTGLPTVESLVPKDGKVPTCSSFTD